MLYNIASRKVDNFFWSVEEKSGNFSYNFFQQVVVVMGAY